ncbi:O-antigen ligase family protein [Catenuloplanes indicus]|uniref:O-antigen ligase n=1 Tax=Catenuloplanes indicus TaxID=137267 RepID=A0AAE3W839_9ACTN|nr:O-antigen ligase family protein [Catenuloplanes indicus]MDQ0371060.1 O-antigen ligase [Catenuloplanes indicus]
MTDRITDGELPLWPLAAMFGAVPLLWLSGGFYLGWPLLGGLLGLVLLARRSRVELPTGSGLWLVFCVLVLISAIRLDAGGLVVAALRFGFYVAAFLLLLYAYTALRDGQGWERVFRPLCLFWLSMVALGWLGVLLPTFAAVSPIELLLPAGLRANPFLSDLVHLRSSEYSTNATAPIYRPSAPFAYTNTWGSAWALLVPCVIAYVLSVRRGPLRRALLISLPLSLPPAFLTLNRGMFVSLGAGLLLLAARGIGRRQTTVVVSVVAATLLAGAVWLVIPVDELISARTSSSDTTTDRIDLYRQALLLAERSPVIGYGAPVTVDTTTAQAPVGTQGQIWQVLVSHGVPALLCFLAFFVVTARRSGRAVSPAGQWLATVPVIGAVQLPYYGLTFHNLTVLCYAIGLSMAAVDGPVRRAAPLPPAGAAPARGSGSPAPDRGGTAEQTA